MRAPYRDILTLLREQAAARGTAIAIESDGGYTITYADLLKRVEILAVRLRSAGVKSSTSDRPRVGIILPNGQTMSVTLLAASCMGVALPFNPAYKLAEFEAYFRETRIGHLILPETGADIPAGVAQRLGINVVRIGADGSPVGFPCSGAVISEGAMVPPDPNDVALVLLTSGSTGRAKSVPLTHRNVLTSARDVCESVDLGPSDRCLSMWELFHVGGLVDLLLAPLHSGGTVISTSGFDAAAFSRLLHEARPTWFQAVPTALREIVFRKDRVERTSLRFIRSVAAALPPALMKEVETLFRVPVIQTFGMTEAGPLISSTRLPPAIRKPGSVGTSCGADIAIIGPGYRMLNSGETGEVAVRGDNVFSGYEGETTAFYDGWFRTGDIGYIDSDGHLFLTGRTKELINRGGEKVNLREVDDCMLAHPAVAEAASYPVAHRTLGEEVAAAVVLKEPGQLTDAELRAFMAERLATFKIPQRIEFLERLPRNAVGKIDRLSLTEAAKNRAVAADSSSSEATDLEAHLARIWANELGVDKVGPEQSFFDLGGDSLSGVRIFLGVEKALGHKLPDAALTGLTTVRQMARVITEHKGSEVISDASAVMESGLTASEERSLAAVMAMGNIPPERPGSPVKVVRRDGRRRPLIWCFNSPAVEMPALAEALGPDQPIYGLYSGGRLFPRTDEKMIQVARYYAREITSLFPEGPLIIGGNCQGGWVAIRLTQHLTAMGRTVEKLCLQEYAEPGLTKIDSHLLLMFGRQSLLCGYRWINWGEPGWEERFRYPPTVRWIAGAHAGFFYRHTIGSFVRILVPFIAGEPCKRSRLEILHDSITTFIHRFRLLFKAYLFGSRICEFARRGRRIRLHPFTGEPETPQPWSVWIRDHFKHFFAEHDRDFYR